MARASVKTTLAPFTSLLIALVVSAPAHAGPTRAQRAQSGASLASIVERPDASTAHRYGAKDDRGAPLEGLKVVQVDGRNIGLYHAPGGGRFNVYVATSDDLISWKRRDTIDEDASQATIAVLPGGSLLVAYEKTTLVDLLPRPPAPAAELLKNPLRILEDPFNRIRVRFRYYRSADDLLNNEFARQFTAPRLLSPTAEGTPSITNATLRGGLISQSRIEVGLHYFANSPGQPQVDRRGTAVLTNFSGWEERARPDLDAEFLDTKARHSGFAGSPAGSIGDRDQIIFDGVRLELQEAQYIPNDYTSWRTFLVDPRSTTPRPLQIITGGGSRSFGNPSVTELTAPDGSRAVFVSVYVFSEGAAKSEAGPLIYYREL
ncbi:MAG: hypothetical protein QOK16_1339 [Solirubrobacteraceae bacterium]|jgi:hypothetical protein|nr:hypothetical protein [Solirubrobacteraceae bacterium]